MFKLFIKSMLDSKRWPKGKLLVSLFILAICATINLVYKLHPTLPQRITCQRELDRFEKGFNRASTLWFEQQVGLQGSESGLITNQCPNFSSIVFLQADRVAAVSNHLYISDSLLRVVAATPHNYAIVDDGEVVFMTKCCKQGDKSAVAVVNLAHSQLAAKLHSQPSMFNESTILPIADGVDINDESGRELTFYSLDNSPIFKIRASDSHLPPVLPDIIMLLAFAMLVHVVSGYIIDRYITVSITKAILVILTALLLLSLAIWPLFVYATLALPLIISGAVASNHSYLLFRANPTSVDSLGGKSKERLFMVATLLYSLLTTIPSLAAVMGVCWGDVTLMLLPIPLLQSVIQINLILLYKTIFEKRDKSRFLLYYFAPQVIVMPVCFAICGLPSVLVVVSSFCVALASFIEVKYSRLAIFYIFAFIAAIFTTTLLLYCLNAELFFSRIAQFGTVSLPQLKEHLLQNTMLGVVSSSPVSVYQFLTLFIFSSFVNITLLLLLIPHAIYPSYVSDISKKILRTMFLLISSITLICVVALLLLVSHIRTDSMRIYIAEVCANIDRTYSQNSSIERCKSLFTTVDILDLTTFSPRGKIIESTMQQAPTLMPQRLSTDMCSRVNSGEMATVNTNSGYNDNRPYISAFQPLNSGDIMVIHIDKASATDKFSYKSDKISLFLLSFLLLLLVFVTLFYNHITRPLDSLNHNLKSASISGKIEFSGSSISSDVTKLIEQHDILLDELEKQHRYLLTTERERTWNRMIKLVAHEIKNPLTPMLLKTQLLRSKIESGREGWESEVEPLLTLIEEQIDRIAMLIKKMAASPKEFIGEGLKMNISQFLDQTLLLFNNISNIRLTSTVKLENRVSHEVYMRREMLFTVISNIIYNAIDAINEAEVEQGIIALTTTISPSLLIIEIQNNGAIIPKEQLDEIFVYQHTTKKTGYGVGLFTVEMLLNIAKGSISVVSNEEQGTIFKVVLPI